MNTLQILKKAIEEQVPIQFNYIRPEKTAGLRIGNPHAVFIKKLKSGEEHIYVHIWQTDGVTDSGGDIPGWRQFHLNDITDVVPLPEGAPFVIAKGYNPTFYKYPIAKI